MKITLLIQNLNFKNYSNIAKINFCNKDFFEKRNENKKVKISQLYQQLQKYGLGNIDLIKLRVFFHKSNIDLIDRKNAATLCSIYSKASNFDDMFQFLQTAYNSRIVAPEGREVYLNYCNELYNIITPNGRISANLASRLALYSLEETISEDDVNVAAFLNNYRANEHPTRKIDEGSAVFIAKRINSNNQNGSRVPSKTNIEKLETLCEYYFYSKQRISPKTALLLANLTMSDKDPQKADTAKFDIIMDLLTRKVNSKILDENEIVQFVNFSFRQPEYFRNSFLGILKDYYNTKAYYGRLDINAVIEICKLELENYHQQYKLLYMDYYNDISRMGANNNWTPKKIAEIAADFTKNTPKEMIRNTYYKIDLEKLYSIYGGNNEGISVSLFAKILKKYYSKPNAYKMAEKEMRKMLGYH